MKRFLRVIAGITALIALDATIGRWLLGLLTTTFRASRVDGKAPQSDRLLVYLPGVLFDGDESVAEIKDAMLEHVATGLFISYGFHRFLPKVVVKKTAAAIGRQFENKFSSIVLVGASFGGRFAADVVLELHEKYGWGYDAIEIIMVDTPCENNSFQEPGLTVSLIMKRLFIGPLISAIAAPLVKLTLVPPYDVDIEVPAFTDHEEYVLELKKQNHLAMVKKRAVDRMAKFRLSSVADQQRYLADNSIEWIMRVIDVKVTYLWCNMNNITVVQPAAMNRIKAYMEGKISRFKWLTVASPHCGFTQLPMLWAETFRQLLKEAPLRETQFAAHTE